MAERVETVIVGGGQAGLSLSYYLQQQGDEHIVLEKADQAGEAWRNHRWDSFTLVTPNFAFRIPGAEYRGDDPEGFMPRDQIVSRFEKYVDQYALPVRYGVQVMSVETGEAGGRYLIRTNTTDYRASKVVIATGLFQGEKIPGFASDLPPGVLQLHSGQYRNPDALPPGAVLVVGSGQSGCQIAEELYQSGRKVYLCLGSAGRVPRRYRGKDIIEWFHLTGFLDKTPGQLPSLAARFHGNPQLSGKHGGHTLNVHEFCRDGVILLGHLQGIQDNRLILAPDVGESLTKIDRFEGEMITMIETYLKESGEEAPEDELPIHKDGYQAAEIESLDLKDAGISTVIWARGYIFDFRWVKFPVLDEFGFPVTNRGVTAYRGLYFLGMPWLNSRRSGILWGVGDDAAFLAEHIDSE